jgi:cytochrome c peroxidase
MSSNEQQNSEFNFDGMTSFSQMFRAAWGQAEANQEDMSGKSYEQILEEYEKFFSMEEEMSSTADSKSKKSSNIGKTRGANVIKTLELSFAE